MTVTASMVRMYFLSFMPPLYQPDGRASTHVTCQF